MRCFAQLLIKINSRIPRASLIISERKAQAVVIAPVTIPFALFRKVASKDAAIEFPAALRSVNPVYFLLDIYKCFCQSFLGGTGE